MKPITENIIEESAIEILQSQGWEYANGKEISPEGLFCERENYSQIVLVNRLRTAIAKINPEIPLDAQEAAIQKVLRIASPDLLHNNEEFHRLLVEKVKIPYQQNGYERSHEVALIDFENTDNNQFLIVNQYTIIENNQNKRPDVLLFVNGLPLVVIELKNAASENASIKSAYQQIQTYKAIIPGLFTYNAICILSDGLECKAGSVSADLSRYMTWKTADGIKEASRFKPQPEAYYENSFKFNYRRFFAVNAQEKLSIILQTEEHILGLQDGKERFIREVSLLSQALSLCITKDEVQPHLPEVAFFQAVKARLAKFDAPTGGGRTDLEIETAIKQIVDEALSSDKVIDIFDAAGIDKPEISGLEILSDDFLKEVEGMQHKNLAIELLKKILNNELKARAKTNLVKSKKLLEMLESAIKRYQNNLLTTAEIIQELINIAKQIKEADKEGEKLGLNNDEVAFYNALEINDSAVQVLGDETLKEIAREIADKVRANATIDWTIRESARAKLMVLVRRTLNKWGYPPDKQQKAIDTVMKQAELLADNLVS